MKHAIKLFAILVSIGCSPAYASLIGDTVHFERNFNGNTFNSVDFVVGPGIENNGEGGVYQIDVGDDYLMMLAGPSVFGQFGGAPHTMEFSSLDWVDTEGIITGFEFSFSNLLNVTASDVSFTEDSVTVDISNMFTNNPSWWRVDLITDHTPVPEPGILGSLLGAAFIGLGLTRRKRTPEK